MGTAKPLPVFRSAWNRPLEAGWVAADGFVIELTYGPDVDWYKNVLTSGGCTLIWHGKDYVIDKLTPMDTETGRAAFPLLVCECAPLDIRKVNEVIQGR